MLKHDFWAIWRALRGGGGGGGTRTGMSIFNGHTGTIFAHIYPPIYIVKYGRNMVRTVLVKIQDMICFPRFWGPAGTYIEFTKVSTNADAITVDIFVQPGTQLTHHVTTTLHLSCGKVVSYTTFTQCC